MGKYTTFSKIVFKTHVFTSNRCYQQLSCMKQHKKPIKQLKEGGYSSVFIGYTNLP